MTIQDTAIEKLRNLPDPHAQLVNDFIDILLNQWAKLPQPSSHQTTSPTATTPADDILISNNQAAWESAMNQIADPDPNQYAAVTHLFATWDAEDDAAEQQETLQWLIPALDNDRISIGETSLAENSPLSP